MRKFLLIVLGIIVILPLLALAMIMIALSSDLPREITEKRLQEKLGTEVSIKKQNTTWDGNSKLSGLRVKIPGFENSFIDIESMQVEHNNIFKLLTRGLKVSNIQADGISTVFSSEGEPVKILSGAKAKLKIYRNKNRIVNFHIQEPYWGQIEGLASLEEGLVEIERVSGKIFGGDFGAQAAFDPNNLEHGRFEIKWKDIDLKKLAKWQGGAEQYLSVVSGQIEVKPTSGDHPFEPLEFHGGLDFKESVFDGLKVTDLQFSGEIGKNRLLVTDLRAAILGGNMQARVKLTKLAENFSVYTNFKLNDIDINQALSQDSSQIEGRLDASGFFVTSGDKGRMNGSVDLSLEKSNLAQSKIVGTLYNSLKLKFGRAKAEGKGDARLRLVGTRLEIADFYYYNQGVELKGTGQVEDLEKGSSSAIKGIVLATTRPFKDIDLPVVSTLDKFLLLVQEDISAVQVGGTLSQVEVKVIALPEIQETLRKFFGGQEKN